MGKALLHIRSQITLREFVRALSFLYPVSRLAHKRRLLVPLTVSISDVPKVEVELAALLRVWNITGFKHSPETGRPDQIFFIFLSPCRKFSG